MTNEERVILRRDFLSTSIGNTLGEHRYIISNASRTHKPKEPGEPERPL
jgi:hypothetical protein